MLVAIPILLAFLAIRADLVHAAPRKLSEVFDVNMAGFEPSNGNPNQGSWHGSCLRPLNNPQFPGNTKPLFDPAADFNSRDNILNNIWYQIYQMTYQARVALGNTNLKTYPEAQKLIWSFWAIWWTDIWSETNPNGSVQPRGQIGMKLKAIRDRYKKLHELFEPPQSASPMSRRDMPKLSCDSTYFELQDRNDPALDKNGKEIIDPETDEPYNLKDWEAEHGRIFEDMWYLWYDIGTDKGYLVLSRKDYPPEAPNKPWQWALDKDTGEPSYCAQGTEKGTERMGAVFVPIEAYEASSDSGSSDEDEDHGADAWTQSNHIILCPQSFNAGRPDDFLEPEYDDSTLDDMEITALTLYHELWHHLYPGRWAPDYKAMPAVRDANNKVSPLWPAHKAGYRTDYEHDISGALESMQLAQYERAIPETLNINEFKTWRCPECYAWFGRAYYLTVKAEQDWSTGLLRPHGSPFVGPTENAPNDKHAVANISAHSFGTIEAPYEGWDFDKEDELLEDGEI
ncbi:hypothetical protein CB0940_00654 [Cercospora beticola]|uniref:Tyrosinase copper-binding domain-containing protein n=1 Tax=Cercospora beticola TaxID=122368 RepID=A0A2G5I6T3_CERBT|nr:hypothetical protein CB0940_00654 [Cercospora beticola]PIB00469.1 hypothetical protein CB0940_00654 [Cercospora beticola]WPA96080.1 hypothetical protein RHO25_000686 [Cercospora beticola]CAK1355640.1 unnamed protein product [Cercospora beticola]